MNTSDNLQKPAEKYITFMIAQEKCGLLLSEIGNIQSWRNMKTVSQTRNGVIGKITSFQERDIPVLDLRERLGLGVANCNEHTLIIEAIPNSTCKHAIVGLAIDTVRPFQDVSLQGIKEQSHYKGKIKKAFVQAVGMCGENAITILRLSQIVNSGVKHDAEKIQ